MQVNSTHPIFLREDGLKTRRGATQRSHVELIRFWVTWWKTWIYYEMVKTQLTEQDSAWFYIYMFVCVFNKKNFSRFNLVLYLYIFFFNYSIHNSCVILHSVKHRSKSGFQIIRSPVAICTIESTSFKQNPTLFGDKSCLQRMKIGYWRERLLHLIRAGIKWF